MKRIVFYINKILVSVLLCCAFADAAAYKPLTREERRLLKDAALAIKIASEKNQTSNVLEFAPEIIEKYKSVLLDPASEKYRVYYDEIKNYYQKAVEVEDINEWKTTVDAARSDSARIEIRDKFISHLDSVDNNRECVAQQVLFEKEVEKYAAENSSINAYAFIARMKNVPQQYKDKMKREMEKKYDETMAQLCNTTDIRKLKAFQGDYPDLFRKDIEAIIQKLTDKKRLRLLEKPGAASYREYVTQTGDTSVALMIKVKRRLERDIKAGPRKDRFEEYFAFSNEPDEQIVALYDDYMYEQFKGSLSLEFALEYLEIFPEGKKAAVVRTWMRNLQNYDKNNTLSASDSSVPN